MAVRAITRPSSRHLITTIREQFASVPNQPLQHFSTISPAVSSKQSHHRKVISLADVFKRYGFAPLQVHDLLTRNHFLMNRNSSEIEKSLKALLSLRPSQEFLFSVVSNCPQILEHEFLEKWKSIDLSEMGISNVSPLVIQNILEVSNKFSLGPKDLSRCVQRLNGLGLSVGTVCRVLEEYPMVLVMNENGIREKVEFLLGIGFDMKEIDKIVNVFPGILVRGVKNKLKLLFDELDHLGFSLNEVRYEISRDPNVLGLELGELSRCLEWIRTLKCRETIKEKIFSMGAFRAGFAVKQRVDVLCKHGLILRDAFKVLWKEPRAILYEIDDIEKKIEFLVNKMNFDVQWLVDVPEYIGVSFEKQIVPRCNVIEYLRSKGWLGDEVGLKRLITLSRMRFYNLYVKPYPECEKIFPRFAGDGVVRNKHPIGMWKLFKPKTYPDSKEDIRNMRSFME